MPRTQRKLRANGVQNYHESKAQIEQQEIYDDSSLLPTAEEVARYHEIDPEILPWMKERAALEQDARHSFLDRKMNLLELESGRNFRIDRIAIIAAFIIVILGMGLTYVLLVYANEPLMGTIFGGATIVMAANSFLSFRKKIAEKKQ
jgi:uncharacterized membrane protein